jgi:hypothetical protein
MATGRADAHPSGIVFQSEDPNDVSFMRNPNHLRSENGSGAGYLLMWLLGVPVPVLMIIFLFRSCS